jgi:hypothetical protein
MGIVLVLYTLSDASIERLLADPPLVWRVVAPEDPELYAEARAAQRPPGFLARFLGRAAKSTPNVEWEPAPDECAECDLDKSWHGLHYLLTGSAAGGDPPLDFLMEGGRAVGDVDVGYGPARAFTSAELGAIQAALAQCSDTELHARFDPARMTNLEIQPDIWQRRPEDEDAWEYLEENLAALREFLGAAAARRRGMLVRLT